MGSYIVVKEGKVRISKLRISPNCVIPRSDLHHGLVLPQQVPAVLPVRAQPRLPPPALLLLPAQLRTPVRRPLHTLDNGRSSPQNLIRDRYHVQDFVKIHHPVHGTALYHLYKEYSFISVFVSKENCSWIYLFVIISLCMEIIR